ncbi:DUF2637 domain-containing protein, partial [Frankia sp. CIT1]
MSGRIDSRGLRAGDDARTGDGGVRVRADDREAAGKRSVAWPLIVSLVLIAGVWAAGAVWSYDHQSHFAQSLGFHHGYLLPAVADGLPVAMAAVAFSAVV